MRTFFAVAVLAVVFAGAVPLVQAQIPTVVQAYLFVPFGVSAEVDGIAAYRLLVQAVADGADHVKVEMLDLRGRLIQEMDLIPSAVAVAEETAIIFHPRPQFVYLRARVNVGADGKPVSRLRAHQKAFPQSGGNPYYHIVHEFRPPAEKWETIVGTESYLAVLNPSSGATVVSFTLMGESGMPTPRVSRLLEAGESKLFSMSELFPSGRGKLEVSAEVGIVMSNFQWYSDHLVVGIPTDLH